MKKPEATTKAILQATPKTTLKTPTQVRDLYPPEAPSHARTHPTAFSIGAFSFTIDNKEQLKGPHKKFSFGNQRKYEPVPIGNIGTAQTGSAQIALRQNNEPNFLLTPSSSARTTSSNTKFIKPPLATANWQKVARKREKKNKEYKNCFFCKKPGHIQRNCWKRIKCNCCGRFGHKLAHCLFKNRIPVSTTQNNSQNNQENPRLAASNPSPLIYS